MTGPTGRALASWSVGDRLYGYGRRVGRVLFGDRTGLVLWLALVVVLAVPWRVGFFIADTYAVANTLLNVAQGSLAVREVEYSLTLLSQPGLHESGGRLYGRNYGQVVFAVPFAWALQAATAVAPLHLVLAGLWSLAVLALFDQAATVSGRPWLRGAGSGVGSVAFAANVLAGVAMDPALATQAALQLSTIVAAGFAGVFGYRLVATVEDQSVAVATGAGTTLALPVAFWASIPKRHVLVATLLLGTAYAFARSRHESGRRAYTALFGAYLLASLVAWVHAFEGFFVLAALTTVDFLTGGVRDRRRLAAVGAGVAVGLAPTLATNWLVSGNPLEPPRLLPNLGSGGIELAPTGEVAGPADGASGGGDGGGTGAGGGSSRSGSGSGGSGGLSPDGGGFGPLDALLAALPLGGLGERVRFVAGFVVTTLRDGLGVLGDPGRLWHIFVRSGRVPGIRYDLNDFAVIELTLVESAPLLGGLFAAPVVLGRKLLASDSRLERLERWLASPAGQTDLLVLAVAGLFTLVYLSRLPLVSQITVRYILPTAPLWLYLLVRLEPVSGAIAAASRPLAYAYLVGTGVTLVASTVVLWILGAAVGESMQFHALVNLGGAGLFASALVGRAVRPDRVSPRSVAGAVGIAAGVTTGFYLIAGLEYFPYGPFTLGVARALSELIPLF